MQIPEDTGHKDTKSADYKVVDSEIREGGRMYIIDVSMSFLSYSVFIFGESTLFINKMLNFAVGNASFCSEANRILAL